MSKKRTVWIRHIKNFFLPLKSGTKPPALSLTSQEKLMKDNPGAFIIGDAMFGNSDERIYRRNAQKLELAKFEQNREAIDKNLKAQHRIMIATLLAVLVALISTGAALWATIHTKPPVVNVQVEPSEAKPPVVNVQPPNVTIER